MAFEKDALLGYVRINFNYFTESFFIFVLSILFFPGEQNSTLSL